MLITKSAMRSTILLQLSAIAILIAAATQANAVTLFDNTGAASIGFDVVNPVALAASFSTGSSPFNISEIDLVVAQTGIVGTSPFFFEIQLRADNDTFPGNSVIGQEFIAESILPAGLVKSSFGFQLSSPLAADTRYWVVVAAFGTTDELLWSGASDVTGPGVATEFICCDLNTDPVSSVPNTFHFGFQMAVIGDNVETLDATPIPAAFPLFATGLGALGLLGFKRRKKRP
jgi:hypothetical protein